METSKHQENKKKRGSDSLDTSDIRNNELGQYLVTARAMISKRHWLAGLPLILPRDNLGDLLERLARENPYQFSWSVSFDIDFVAELMFYGYLTMCEKIDKDSYVLFPKLHHKRCVLFLENLHISKSRRKACKKFCFSANLAFDEVCAGIIKQHGENWFYPPLVSCFKEFHGRNERGAFNGKVRMHSMEVWDSENNLVAGVLEVGYSVGSSYTSLSGFSRVNSAGSVQLVCCGALLIQLGYDMWDLGMDMDYKAELGAKSLDRQEFLAALSQRRLAHAKYLKCLKRSACEIIAPILIRAKQSQNPSTQTNLSKNALKKMRKLENRKLAKASKLSESEILRKSSSMSIAQ